MGANPPTMSWTPKYAQYYKLGFSVDPATNNLAFTFSPGCGYRELQSQADLDQFVVDFTAGSPKVKDFKVKEPGPHFTLFDKAYIAIELDRGNWRFMNNHPGITIGPNHTPNANPKAAYFKLVHIDENGDPTGSKTPVSPGPACRKMYFGVNPRKSTGNTETDKDRFNLFFEIDQDNHVLPLILDPDIKNQGGTDPFLDPPPARKRAGSRKKR
jgi:hypothetical protein